MDARKDATRFTLIVRKNYNKASRNEQSEITDPMFLSEKIENSFGQMNREASNDKQRLNQIEN